MKRYYNRPLARLQGSLGLGGYLMANGAVLCCIRSLATITGWIFRHHFCLIPMNMPHVTVLLYAFSKIKYSISDLPL